jgi:hypothetical protein
MIIAFEVLSRNPNDSLFDVFINVVGSVVFAALGYGVWRIAKWF